MTQDEMNHLLEEARSALLSDDAATEKYDIVLLLEAVKFYLEVIMAAGWPIEQPRRAVNVLQTAQIRILDLRTGIKRLIDEAERVALAEREERQPFVHLDSAIEQAKAASSATGGK